MDCLLNAINNNENLNGTLALALSSYRLTVISGWLPVAPFAAIHFLMAFVQIFLTSSCVRMMPATAPDACSFGFAHLAALLT